MTRLERNFDAYRLCAESLVRLRSFLRQELGRGSGATDDSLPLPDDLRSFLLQRQVREQGIHWGIGESADLLDYAGFANLFDVIAAHEALAQRFSLLAADINLLRSRFLELDTVMNRVAFVRPVSDTELEFLAGFDDRLRRLLSTKPEQVEAPVTTPAPAPPQPRPEPASPGAGSSSRRVSTSGAKDDTAPRREAQKPASPPPPPRMDLEQILAAEDDTAILTALYQEITVVAEGLWAGGTPPLPRVFERVRESEWYRVHFVPLGLKPLSDFYDIAQDAKERLLSGVSRNQVQAFLEERNFAPLLMNLRDFFRRNLPTEAPPAGGANRASP